MTRRAGVLSALAICAALAASAATPKPAPTPPTNGKPATAARPEATAKDRSSSNGFDLSSLQVPRDQIVAGGPARDGIRSVDAPSFAAPEEAKWATPDDPVLGVAAGGEARAYPVHLMEHHQIVNDVVGGKPHAITYDPLTGAPRAFDSILDGRTLHFGVSGLLYNSGFLLYDRETQSLWSQFLGKAIAGPLAGKTLRRLRIRQEDLGAWLSRAPKTRVLARPEPRRIDYRYTPFEAYYTDDKPAYPVTAEDRRFHAKELVLGVVAGGKARAYLGSILTREGGWLEDRFEGRKLEIDYASELGVFRFEAPDDLDVSEAYWFAWKTFHPDTEIWKDPGKAGAGGP